MKSVNVPGGAADDGSSRGLDFGPGLENRSGALKVMAMDYSMQLRSSLSATSNFICVLDPLARRAGISRHAARLRLPSPHGGSVSDRRRLMGSRILPKRTTRVLRDGFVGDSLSLLIAF